MSTNYTRVLEDYLIPHILHLNLTADLNLVKTECKKIWDEVSPDSQLRALSSMGIWCNNYTFNATRSA